MTRPLGTVLGLGFTGLALTLVGCFKECAGSPRSSSTLFVMLEATVHPGMDWSEGRQVVTRGSLALTEGAGDRNAASAQPRDSRL